MKKTVKQLWQQRKFRFVVEFFAILLVIVAVRAYTQKDLVSGVAPALHGRSIAGQHYNLQQGSKRPVLVHFWATWCPVCKLEQDSIQAISRDYDVITVAMQSGNEQEVLDYMSSEGLNYPVINDPQGSLSQRFGVSAVPSSFIIGKDKQIKFRETGFTSEWGLRLRLWWAE